MKVKLKDVIEAIEFEGELLTHYYNTKTGVIMYLEDDSTANYKCDDIENIDEFEDWEKELIVAINDLKVNPQDYIQLPSKDEINECKMIISFAKSVDNKAIKDILEEDLTEDKLIRNLMQSIREIGKINEWYDYRENAEYELAKEWCEKNNISYIE